MKSYEIIYKMGKETKTMLIEAYDKNHAQYKFSYYFWVGLIKKINLLK